MKFIIKFIIHLIKGRYTFSHLLGRFEIFSFSILIFNTLTCKGKPRKLLNNQFKINDNNKFVTKQINTYGYYEGIKLNSKTLKNILKKLKNKKTFHPDFDGRIYGNIKKPLYFKKIGQKLPRAFVDGVDEINEVKKISKDKRMFEIFYDYFGYYPKTINSIIFVNYPVKMKEEERLDYETIKYHFDIESPNSLYWSFYLCDVNRLNSPHALIKRTHKNKPLRLLMRGANIDDSEIFKNYNYKDELILNLDKGKGFIEDASIYHKNFPSKKKTRLMLQLRYY
jgi:hypothetical protein